MFFKIKEFGIRLKLLFNFSKNSSHSTKGAHANALSTIGNNSPASVDHSRNTYFVNLFPCPYDINVTRFQSFLQELNSPETQEKLHDHPEHLQDLYDTAISATKRPDLKSQLDKMIREKINTDPTSRKSNLLSQALKTTLDLTEHELQCLSFLCHIKSFTNLTMKTLDALQIYLENILNQFAVTNAPWTLEILQSAACIQYINMARWPNNGDDIIDHLKQIYSPEIFMNNAAGLQLFRQSETFRKLEAAWVGFTMWKVTPHPLGQVIAASYINNKLGKESIILNF